MTTAGGQAGGSGFEYGENTVAARLSIDIPTEGVQSLREITQEISRFRTEMEAASRSQGDFIGFFQTMPSIASQAANAYKTFADQLERGLALQQRMAGVGQWDVQPGTPEPFKGMSAGMGRDSGDINQTMADLDRMRSMGQVGERQYLNVHQQRGALGGADVPASNSQADIAAATDRISSRERVNSERMGTAGLATGMSGNFGGVARQIMNEFGAGSGLPHQSGEVPHPASGSSGGVGFPGMGMVLGGIGRGMAGIPGLGGIGAGVGALGSAAASAWPITGPLAAFAAAQYAGPRLQGLKEIGLTSGGGIKEGAEIEAQSRIMAMSPFLTNEQSRSILQNALRAGYKDNSKEFETVTQFMKQNLIDFGIGVTDSLKMYQSQIEAGGGSPESIRANLQLQKTLAANPNSKLSFQDRAAAVAALSGQMVSSGADSTSAQVSASRLVEMGSDSNLTKGLAADSFMNMNSDLSGQIMMMNMAGITPSADFGEWGEQLSAAGPEATQKAVAMMFKQSGGNKGRFWMMLNQILRMNVSQQQANYMFNQLKNGKNPLAAADQNIASSNDYNTGVQERSAGEMANAGIGSAVDVLGGTIADVATLNFSNIPQRTRAADWAGQSQHIPVLDQLVQSHGGDPNNIMVQDESGEWQKLQPKNAEQLQALSSGGKWKYANDTNGSGQTLADAAALQQKQDVSVQGEVSLHVTADPGVKVQAPKTFTLTQNQVQSNAGWSTATANNPPPGDR